MFGSTVCVVGLGYIGLPTATLLASVGYRVVGVDINQGVVDSINSGAPHIEEVGLSSLMADMVSEGKLRAQVAPSSADVFIIAVPTPLRDKEADLTYVEAAAKEVAPVLKSGDLVILESTSPVGTTRRVVDIILSLREDLRASEDTTDVASLIHVAYCPERIIPGRMLEELVGNDRIIGGIGAESTMRAVNFYRSFVEGRCIATTAEVAEMVKLAENAFRDVNIAFANELSMICDEMGVNVWDVIELANHHPRVSILSPGAGVGGHCIAVDPWFIVEQAPATANLIRAARSVNEAKPQFICRKVRDYLESHPQAKIVCFGLTYKPDVDDFRESPALSIAMELTKLYPGQIFCVDPYFEALDPEVARDLEVIQLDQAIKQADLAVLLVAHESFRAIEWKEGVALIDAPGITNTRPQRGGTYDSRA